MRHVPMNFLHPHPPDAAGRTAPAGTGGGPAASSPCSAHPARSQPAHLRRRPETLRERQGDMFRAGADALMTGDYLTTQGMGVEEDIRMIEAAGLEVARP